MGLQEAYGQNDGGGGTALAGIVIENPTAADNFVLVDGENGIAYLDASVAVTVSRFEASFFSGAAFEDV